MAEKDKKADGSVTLLNRGRRHFDLGKGQNGSPRRHSPGTTMAYTAEEAGRMAGYQDLVDISKLPGQVNAAKLKSDNDKLTADNEALKARLDALESAPKGTERKVRKGEAEPVKE